MLYKIGNEHSGFVDKNTCCYIYGLIIIIEVIRKAWCWPYSGTLNGGAQWGCWSRVPLSEASLLEPAAWLVILDTIPNPYYSFLRVGKMPNFT